MYQRAEKGGADIDGNPIPIPVPGLPDFASPTLAVRALDTLVNDMLADFKATGQPTAAARQFMKEPGSFIGEILRTGFPKTPGPFDLNGTMLSTLDDVEKAIAKTEKNIDALEAKIKDFGGRPISAALKNSKFEKWRASQLVELDEQIADSRAWIDSAREMVPTGQLTERQQEILIYERDRIRDLENQRVALERDDVYALNQYGQQAAAKRRVDNGSEQRKFRPKAGVSLVSSVNVLSASVQVPNPAT